MIDYMGMGPAGQGADGLTNEQWVNASNPAGKGSEAASSAYRGLETGKANYEKSEEAAAQRAYDYQNTIKGEDIAASYTVVITDWYQKVLVNGVQQGDAEYLGSSAALSDCGCGGQGQPPCKGVRYRYKRTAELDRENRDRAENYGIRMPDFYSLNIGIPTPYLISGTLTFTMDRHFQWYISPGVSVGIPSGRSFSLTASWLTQSRKPTPTQTYNFLSGLSMGMSAGYYGVGGVWNGSPSNLKSNNTANAFGFGIMTPQFGFGYSYTPEFLIFNRK
jgi:hypothetical protein